MILNTIFNFWKKSIGFCILITLPLGTLLSGCYRSENVQSELVLRKSDKLKYEIEIPIHYEGRGNAHQSDPSKYKFDDSDWLYTNKMHGKIYSEELVLTYERNKVDRPYCQSNLRGFIKIDTDSILIQLKIPVYEDQDTIPDAWLSYKHNGIHKLRKE